MPKILILYSSIGSGHHSAAKALREAFERFDGVEIMMEDALSYASSVYRTVIKETYDSLLEQSPMLYQMIYEGSDQDEQEDFAAGNKLVAKLEKPFFSRLRRMLEARAPDIVISVQQIPARFLQELESGGKLTQPHYVVVTDLIAHSSWIHLGVDGYFVPSVLTAELLTRKGVALDMVHVTGIPVGLEISEPKDRATVRAKLGLPAGGPVVAFLGGGLRVKRARSMIDSILRSFTSGVLVIVLGRNEELGEALEEMDLENRRSDGLEVRTLGMIDFMDDLVAASDLVVSKAGGLIVSEVLARGTALIVVDPIPGQEEWNADGVAASGGGIQIRLPEMVGPAIRATLADRERLEAMAGWARKTGQPGAALKVAGTVLEQWTANAE